MNIVIDYESNLIEQNCSLKEALEIMDCVNQKVLFLTKNGQIMSSLTDGDVRRAILKGALLTTEVSEIANSHPYFLENDDEEVAREMLNKLNLEAIPVVNSNKEIIKIYSNFDNITCEKYFIKKKDIPVVIMAGGMGTRLYPYTKILPKPLIPIADIPIVERIMQSFQKNGLLKFHMIINYRKDMIRSYFNEEGVNYDITFWDENEPLGTGGGLYLVKNEIKKTFILTNCDILINDDVNKIIDHHNKEKNVVTLVCSLKNFQIPYGIVHFSEGGEISSFEEKPTMSFFTNTGYYILEPVVFNYIKENEQIGMPEIIERMKKNGEKVGIYPISENAWLDMGQIDSMEVMERKFKELKGIETI